ncbi:MAG TPA: amino acid ABC transporter permease [Solirubrobacteraceae bacterium]|nr:amino acid ABC transporter permease [Solirubrobacteraceae bacterium]
MSAAEPASLPAPSDSRLARAAERRRRARRAIAISSISTFAVLGGLAALLVTSPGWNSVRRTFFSSSAFSDSFVHVLEGFWLDVRMFLVVEAVVLVFGMLIALCRTVRSPALFPLRLLSIVYVDVLRGVPTILVVYLVGFGVPALALSGLPNGAVVLGGLALAMCYSAYVAEVYRAGIESVHPSQSAAALALGLTPAQTLRHVVVPQAVRRVVPPLLNDFIALQKDVALVSILGPQEAFRVAQIFAAEQFNYTPLLAAAALYLCVTIPLTRLVDRLQSRAQSQRGAALALGPR